jgi:hydroxymethylbilane synthase
LIRLDARQRITEFLEPPAWLPAAGQGAIAIEIRAGDERITSAISALHHEETAIAVDAERSFLRSLEGGCQVPIGALAQRNGNGAFELFGFVSDPRGHDIVRGSIIVDEDDPSSSGEKLAADLRTRGASSLLMEIRSSSPLIAPQPE